MADATPTQTVSTWLAQFGAALTQRDIAAALALFDDDCYWRDLVTFTWNITTAEGKDAVKAMLEATRDHPRPAGWKGDGAPTAAGDVPEDRTLVGEGRSRRVSVDSVGFVGIKKNN